VAEERQTGARGAVAERDGTCGDRVVDVAGRAGDEAAGRDVAGDGTGDGTRVTTDERATAIVGTPVVVRPVVPVGGPVVLVTRPAVVNKDETGDRTGARVTVEVGYAGTGARVAVEAGEEAGDGGTGASADEAVARSSTPRKNCWVWRGTCCTTDKAPIIKLFISVHTQHGGCRFCLEVKLGGVLSLE
jgi:hypothetical protein